MSAGLRKRESAHWAGLGVFSFQVLFGFAPSLLCLSRKEHLGVVRSRSNLGCPTVGRTFGHKLFRTLFTSSPREWLASSPVTLHLVGSCAQDWQIMLCLGGENDPKILNCRKDGNLPKDYLRQWIWHSSEKQSGAVGKTRKKPRKSLFGNKSGKLFGGWTKVWNAYKNIFAMTS